MERDTFVCPPLTGLDYRGREDEGAPLLLEMEALARVYVYARLRAIVLGVWFR